MNVDFSLLCLWHIRYINLFMITDWKEILSLMTDGSKKSWKKSKVRCTIFNYICLASGRCLYFRLIDKGATNVVIAFPWQIAEHTSHDGSYLINGKKEEKQIWVRCLNWFFSLLYSLTVLWNCDVESVVIGKVFHFIPFESRETHWLRNYSVTIFFDFLFFFPRGENEINTFLWSCFWFKFL